VEQTADVEAGWCATSASSLGSPRELADVDSDIASNMDEATKPEEDMYRARTMLKGEAPAFQSMLTGSKFDAAANAVYLALASCGQTHTTKIEKGLNGKSTTLISAELRRGTCPTSRCYDVVHLARQALEEVTTHLDAIFLLSKRIERSEGGYSLRSSVACIPKEAEDRMCWDLFRKGNCPRRCKCQWYHPQEADIVRIKVTVKCTEETSGVSSEEQLCASYPNARRKLSLGELV